MFEKKCACKDCNKVFLITNGDYIFKKKTTNCDTKFYCSYRCYRKSVQPTKMEQRMQKKTNLELLGL